MPAVEQSQGAIETTGPSTGSDAVPKRVGRFEVRGVLGTGACGRVYRGFDPNLGREVAIKVPLLGALQTDDDRERFLREARAAATISHPNVCPIHEVGEDAGQPYIVMALVPGQTLAAMLASQKEPMPETQTASIVRKLALALDAAHRKGIIHRDLKPANVMFDSDRKDVVVTDFGLARGPRSPEAHATQTGVIMGTPAYMSPEQARGATREIGPAADIYSLGVIMYELLTGQRPFTGGAMEVLGKILHVEPEPPSRRRPELNPRLEAICLTAMAKDPAARFATMSDFAGAIDAAIDAPAVETMRSTQTVTTTRQPESAAAIAPQPGTPRWIFVAIGLLLVAVAGAAAMFLSRPDTVKVTIELSGLDLSDKSLSFELDGKPIAATELAKPVELSVGEHVLLVRRGKDVAKQLLLTVASGTPAAKVKDITPPTDSPKDPKKDKEPPDPKKDPVDPKRDPNEDGFVSLFNGKDLTGWDAPSRPESFGVDPDGLLTVKGDTPAGGVHWLYSKKEYSDYVLRLDFKFVLPLPTGTATAITPRAALEKGATGSRSARLRVPLKNLAEAPRSGAVLYTINDAVDPKPPVGELATGTWHSLEMEVRGGKIKISINGKLANDVDLSKIDRTLLNKNEKWAEAELDRRKGHIGLLSWRNAVKFRNIRLKELTDPAP